MEIISQYNYVLAGWFLIILGVLNAIALVVLLIKKVKDKVFHFLTILYGTIFLASGLVCLVDDNRYRLRVDSTTTVQELKDTYNIISYDADNDVWIVKEKK